MTPYHRLREHFAERERDDTLAYVDYCLKRAMAGCPYTLAHEVSGRVILLAFGFEHDGETFLARFRVMPSWDERKILRACTTTVRALRRICLVARNEKRKRRP